MSRTPGSGARAGLVGATALVLVVTTAVALVRSLRYAYEAPGLQIALNTADAVIALVVAYLVYGRYRQRSRGRDLLLAASLIVLAIANLPLTAVPQALALQGGEHLEAWAPLFVRTLGAVLFAAAALTPRRVRVTRRVAARGSVGVLAAVAWFAGFGLLAADRLPPPVPLSPPTDTASPWVTGHPLVLVLQAVGVVLYLAAAVAFVRAARRERDDFLDWLAAAAVLAAGARINYLLFPSLYTDYLYTGDLLRLGFYLLLLLGAAREVRAYWSARLGTAVVRGRRDALREVEDTVMEDLREVVDGARRLRAEFPRSLAPDVVAASQRALEAVEQALAELRAPGPDQEESFEVQLRDMLHAVAARHGLVVEVRVDPAAEPRHRSEALLSIAAEAARGAGRFGGGSLLQVSVTAEPLRLVVRDDGCGTRPGDPPRADGLGRMRRRAASTGGAVTVTSSGEGGTTVTVDWL